MSTPESLEVAPDSWDRLLAELGSSDAYYLRGYIESAAALYPARAAFLLAGDSRGAVAFPCLIRELPRLGVRDVSTFTYGGPLALGANPPVEEFFARYETWCRDERIVTTFVRFHPLFANHRVARSHFSCDRIAGTVSWPLTGDLLVDMHRHHRRLVRKAEAAGIGVQVVVGRERLDEFAALYATTMSRIGASDFYFFPTEYWQRLEQTLQGRIVRFDALLGGRLVASILCLATPPWLHYHLGASADEGRQLGASHLLLYAAARYGQQNGFEALHLGSGVGAGGGDLLEFKQRFSPGTPLLEQWLGKAVHDVERYSKLTGTRSISDDAFFPAYRVARD